ncbi:MAG: radical SAM protein [Deltaproteobacteria bacterium]|nr:radical SAM protein [Deltaproteobacteria bacterium]
MKIERRTVQFQPNTRNFFFHILTQCNLRCRHCYINPEQHGRQILDERTLARWLAIFANNYPITKSPNHRIPQSPNNTNVIFLGGEPTLSPALPHGIKEARRLGYASITVDTNGYLFNDILDMVSPEDLDYFSFSLDGSHPKVNDFIRGEGVFDICTSGIRLALEKGFGVSVIFTASRMNIHDLVNMPPLLTDLGVKRFFIQVIGIRGKPARKGETALQLSREEWETVVPEVAGKFVFPNGRVYTCPLCEDYPIHSMEIVDGVLKERPPIRECDLFSLQIPEGCVLNKILHPGNISYDSDGRPVSRIACCMLKEEVLPAER